MSTYTTIAICNKALVLCGASPISSLTENSANARALNAVFDISRQDFLTECRWTFSTTRSTLSTVATTTIAWYFEDESYVYTKPADALRIWDMSDLEAIWREEGSYIISDTGDLGVRYSFDQSELGLWSPKAMMAFIDKLCSDIAYQIINSVPKAEAFLKKYLSVSLPNAMAESSQTGTSQQINDSAWLKSKFGQEGNPANSYG